MVLRGAFVVARNRAGRPTLQHRLLDGQTHLTACGRDVARWSRALMNQPIHAILCKHPACWASPTRGRNR